MEITRHSDSDRLRTAELAGTLIRQAYLVHYEGQTIDGAVAALHSFSTDTHLLAHALGDPDEGGETVLAIATAAGVDLDDARRWAVRPRRQDIPLTGSGGSPIDRR